MRAPLVLVVLMSTLAGCATPEPAPAAEVPGDAPSLPTPVVVSVPAPAMAARFLAGYFDPVAPFAQEADVTRVELATSAPAEGRESTVTYDYAARDVVVLAATHPAGPTETTWCLPTAYLVGVGSRVYEARAGTVRPCSVAWRAGTPALEAEELRLVDVSNLSSGLVASRWSLADGSRLLLEAYPDGAPHAATFETTTGSTRVRLVRDELAKPPEVPSPIDRIPPRLDLDLRIAPGNLTVVVAGGEDAAPVQDVELRVRRADGVGGWTMVASHPLSRAASSSGGLDVTFLDDGDGRLDAGDAVSVTGNFSWDDSWDVSFWDSWSGKDGRLRDLALSGDALDGRLDPAGPSPFGRLPPPPPASPPRDAGDDPWPAPAPYPHIQWGAWVVPRGAARYVGTTDLDESLADLAMLIVEPAERRVLARFPLAETAFQSANGFGFAWRDEDRDGKLSAGDSFSATRGDWTPAERFAAVIWDVVDHDAPEERPPTLIEAPPSALANGGFEDGLRNWTIHGPGNGGCAISASADWRSEGNASARLDDTDDVTPCWISQRIRIGPGATYEATARVLVERLSAKGNGERLVLSWQDASGSSFPSDLSTATRTGEATLTVIGTAPLHARQVEIVLSTSDGFAGAFLVDAVTFTRLR